MSVKCVGAAWAENLPPKTTHPALPSLAMTLGDHQRALAVCGNRQRGAGEAEVGTGCAGSQGPRRNSGPEREKLPRLVGVVAETADRSHPHPHGNREGCAERPLTHGEG